MKELNCIDIGLRLREVRRASGLSQREAGLLSGVGFRTISSFESGRRVSNMKVSQLHRLLDLYCVSEGEFFADDFDAIVVCGEDLQVHRTLSILRIIHELPEHVRENLVGKIQLIADTAHTVHTLTAHVPLSPTHHDWELLNSRN